MHTWNLLSPNSLGQLLQLNASSRKPPLTPRVILVPLFHIPTAPVAPTKTVQGHHYLQQSPAKFSVYFPFPQLDDEILEG